MPLRSSGWPRSIPLVIDKTGTLTEGKPALDRRRGGERVRPMTTCCASPPRSKRERASLAEAILRGATKRELRSDKVDGLRGGDRTGCEGTDRGDQSLLGNRADDAGSRHRRRPARPAAEARRSDGADGDVPGRRRQARRHARRGRSDQAHSRRGDRASCTRWAQASSWRPATTRPPPRRSPPSSASTRSMPGLRPEDKLA